MEPLHNSFRRKQETLRRIPSEKPSVERQASTRRKGKGRDDLENVQSSEAWATVAAGKNWKRNRGSVWHAYRRSSLYACVFALLGTCSSIVQNELVIRQTYPDELIINILKAINSGFSLLSVLLVIRVYWLGILLARLSDHIDRGLVLDASIGVRDIFSQAVLWVEIFICGIHLPPYITFEAGATTLQNYILYRAETLGCLVNTFRLYLVWRVVRDKILSSIPQFFIVASYTEARLQTSYVVKLLLNSWAALVFIAVVWSGAILLLSYWFRCLELTACLFETTANPACDAREAQIWSLGAGDEFEKVNDAYMWNHLWMIFIVSTKGNNAAFRPTTHQGRVVAAFAAGIGIVLTAFLTASLGQALRFTTQEDSANLIIRRERARENLKVYAVNIISRWYRKVKKRPLSKRQRSMLRSNLIRNFFETRRHASGDIDELHGQSEKIDNLQQRSKRMEYTLYNMAAYHQLSEVLSFYEDQRKAAGLGFRFSSFDKTVTNSRTEPPIPAAMHAAPLGSPRHHVAYLENGSDDPRAASHDGAAPAKIDTVPVHGGEAPAKSEPMPGFVSATRADHRATHDPDAVKGGYSHAAAVKGVEQRAHQPTRAEASPARREEEMKDAVHPFAFQEEGRGESVLGKAALEDAWEREARAARETRRAREKTPLLRDLYSNRGRRDTPLLLGREGSRLKTAGGGPQLIDDPQGQGWGAWGEQLQEMLYELHESQDQRMAQIEDKLLRLEEAQRASTVLLLQAVSGLQRGGGGNHTESEQPRVGGGGGGGGRGQLAVTGNGKGPGRRFVFQKGERDWGRPAKDGGQSVSSTVARKPKGRGADIEAEDL